MSKLLKNPDIGTGDVNCGKILTPYKMSHSDKRFFFERYSLIKNQIQLELHSKLLFHKEIAISRYGTMSDTHVKSHFPGLLNQK